MLAEVEKLLNDEAGIATSPGHRQGAHRVRADGAEVPRLRREGDYSNRQGRNARELRVAQDKYIGAVNALIEYQNANSESEARKRRRARRAPGWCWLALTPSPWSWGWWPPC